MEHSEAQIIQELVKPPEIKDLGEVSLDPEINADDMNHNLNCWKSTIDKQSYEKDKNSRKLINRLHKPINLIRDRIVWKHNGIPFSKFMSNIYELDKIDPTRLEESEYESLCLHKRMTEEWQEQLAQFHAEKVKSMRLYMLNKGIIFTVRTQGSRLNSGMFEYIFDRKSEQLGGYIGLHDNGKMYLRNRFDTSEEQIIEPENLRPPTEVVIGRALKVLKNEGIHDPVVFCLKTKVGVGLMTKVLEKFGHGGLGKKIDRVAKVFTPTANTITGLIDAINIYAGSDKKYSDPTQDTVFVYEVVKSS